MTDKELRKLNRTELLEMLIAQSKEVERLRGRLSLAEEELQSRKLEIAEAGSIAEAALKVNGVFTAAEAAAKQYLENIEKLSGNQEEICRRMEADAQKKADRIVKEAQEKADLLLKEAEQRAAEAEKSADKYWKEVSAKLQRFYQEHREIKELLEGM